MGEWERLAFNSFKFHLKLRLQCVDSPVRNTETTVTHKPPCVSGSLLDSKEGVAIKFKGEGGRHFGEVGVEEIISH